MATVIVSAGTSARPTGFSTQAHLIFAVNNARWWAFCVLSGSQTTLRSYYSTGLVSWTAGTTFTLTNSVTDGRNFGVVYKNISSVDVLEVSLAYEITASSHRGYALRGTISGTTITWGTETQIGLASTQNDAPGVSGPVPAFSSSNIAFHLNSFGEQNTNDYPGNPNHHRATSADPTLPSVALQAETVPWSSQFHAWGILASGNMLALFDNGANQTTYTNVRSMLWNGSSWSAGGNAATVLGTAQDRADLGVVGRTTTDIHLVVRTGANTYEHRRHNGTSWAAGQSISTQNSKASGGLFLATDGTDVWLFAIDSDAANTVRYAKWTASGPSWGTWVALETSTKTRTFVTGYPLAVAGSIGVLYSEVNGSNYDVVATSLNTSGVVAWVPFNVDRQLVAYRWG